MDPDSDFVAGLADSLPDDLPFYLFFGYQRRGNAFMLTSHDTVVAVASQLPLWAQQKATMVRGFDLDHMEILTHPVPVQEFLSILAEH